MTKIIAFDGIDGVGKTTLISNIYTHLLAQNISVELLALPHGAIRTMMLAGGLSDTIAIAGAVLGQATLFLESLKPCEYLLIDRYSASAYVYQWAEEQDLARRQTLARVIDLYPKPDLHVWLRAKDTLAAAKRIPDHKRNRFDPDGGNKSAFRQRQYEAYYGQETKHCPVLTLTDSVVENMAVEAIWSAMARKVG